MLTTNPRPATHQRFLQHAADKNPAPADFVAGSRHGSHTQRGSSSVELAVVAPLALVLLLSVLQAGLWFYAHSVCEHAAQRGVDAARTASGTSGYAEQAAHVVTDRAAGMAAHPRVTAHVNAQTVRVQVTTLTPRVLPIPGLDLRAEHIASAAKERFTTPGPTAP